MRRAGVVVAVIGTAVAAPEGTAVIWRAIKAALGKVLRKIHVFLARYLKFLRRSVTVQARTGWGVAQIPTPSIQARGLPWHPDESFEDKVERLHEQLIQAYSEIDQVRQEAREGDDALRRTIEEQATELRAAHHIHQAEHVAAQRQAAMVDARGILLLGVSIFMTGVPDGLATVAWLGWLVIVGALALAVGMAWLVWRERHAQESVA